MREVTSGVICAACGTKTEDNAGPLPNIRIYVCPHCKAQYYLEESDISCKLCFQSVCAYHIPSVGRNIIFCSSPSCPGWQIYHADKLTTYFMHDKDLKFILTGKRLFGVTSSAKTEIPAEYSEVHKFVRRVIIQHPCVDNKSRFR